MSEFKCLGGCFGRISTDETECRRKVVSGKRVADAIRSQVYVGGL